MPRWTGTSGIPIQSKTRSVFSVQLSTLVLPLTTVAPTSSMSGDRAAVMSATASSVPVSTSRMIFVAMRQVCPSGRRGAGRRRSARPVDALVAGQEPVDEALRRVAVAGADVGGDEPVVARQVDVVARGSRRRRRRRRAPGCRSSRAGSRGRGPGPPRRPRGRRPAAPAAGGGSPTRRSTTSSRSRTRRPAASQSFMSLFGSATTSKPSRGWVAGSRLGCDLSTSAYSGGSSSRSRRPSSAAVPCFGAAPAAERRARTGRPAGPRRPGWIAQQPGAGRRRAPPCRRSGRCAACPAAGPARPASAAPATTARGRPRRARPRSRSSGGGRSPRAPRARPRCRRRTASGRPARATPGRRSSRADAARRARAGRRCRRSTRPDVCTR